MRVRAQGSGRLLLNETIKTTDHLRNPPKTAAVSNTPGEEIASAFVVSGRASAAFGLFRNPRKTGTISGVPRKEQWVSFRASGHASVPFALSTKPILLLLCCVLTATSQRVTVNARRLADQPLLSPRPGWMSIGVFNPAAVKLGD